MTPSSFTTKVLPLTAYVMAALSNLPVPSVFRVTVIGVLISFDCQVPTRFVPVWAKPEPACNTRQSKRIVRRDKQTRLMVGCFITDPLPDSSSLPVFVIRIFDHQHRRRLVIGLVRRLFMRRGY